MGGANQILDALESCLNASSRSCSCADAHYFPFRIENHSQRESSHLQKSGHLDLALAFVGKDRSRSWPVCAINRLTERGANQHSTRPVQTHCGCPSFLAAVRPRCQVCQVAHKPDGFYVAARHRVCCLPGKKYETRRTILRLPRTSFAASRGKLAKRKEERRSRQDGQRDGHRDVTSMRWNSVSYACMPLARCGRRRAVTLP